jgi:hypothetical protein
MTGQILAANSRLLNDGSAAAPSLRVYLNLDTLIDHPEFDLKDQVDRQTSIQRVRGDGFEGVQFTKSLFTIS